MYSLTLTLTWLKICQKYSGLLVIKPGGWLEGYPSSIHNHKIWTLSVHTRETFRHHQTKVQRSLSLLLLAWVFTSSPSCSPSDGCCLLMRDGSWGKSLADGWSLWPPSYLSSRWPILLWTWRALWTKYVSWWPTQLSNTQTQCGWTFAKYYQRKIGVESNV